MRKWILCAALLMALGMTMKPATANPAYIHSGRVPVELKVAAFLVGAMTTSVMLNAIHVSRTQNRQLTHQEAYYAALLPFFWVFQPAFGPPVVVQPRRRR